MRRATSDSDGVSFVLVSSIWPIQLTMVLVNPLFSSTEIKKAQIAVSLLLKVSWMCVIVHTPESSFSYS